MCKTCAVRCALQQRMCNWCSDSRMTADAHKVLAVERPKRYILPLLYVARRAVVHQQVSKDVLISCFKRNTLASLCTAAEHTRLHTAEPVYYALLFHYTRYDWVAVSLRWAKHAGSQGCSPFMINLKLMYICSLASPSFRLLVHQPDEKRTSSSS